MHNSFENQKRFFALYFGQEVGRFYLSEDDNGLFIVSEAFLNPSWLELKDVAYMTDEDAIKLNEFLKMSDGLEPMVYKAMFLQLFVIDSNDPIKSQFSFKDVSNTIDFVRSMGYAFEWQGLSVEKQFEYGWIKLTK